MKGTCSQQHCHPDSDCVMGEVDPSSCKNWSANESRPQSPSLERTRCSIPWSGSAFGLDDIRLIAARERPRVIALIGPHNAGKTTYLAALHLLCLRKQIDPVLCFSGSWTLGGWERIADFMRYPMESDPSYPPHTPVSTDRTPGLLHYAFRAQDNCVHNLLFTDAPGEWFTEWTINPSPTQYPGASWTVEQADVFLFFIDRESLVGADRGNARHRIKTLAARLSQHLGNRPIGIVWAKSDISIEPELQSAIEDILNRNFPNANHFHTKFKLAKQEARDVVAPLIASFKFAFEPRKVKNTFAVALPPQMSSDRFLAYRGIRDAK